jgi:hypothetical protein
MDWAAWTCEYRNRMIEAASKKGVEAGKFKVSSPETSLFLGIKQLDD